MLAIKPHHFVDILCSLGDGIERFTPHPYGHAVHSVARRLLDAPNTVLRIELQADDICAPCCHNIDGQCDDTIDTSFRPSAPESKREWNLRIDQRWCKVLGIAQDEKIVAIELCRKIQKQLDQLPAIYREIIEPQRIAQRRSRLDAGIRRYLGSKETDSSSSHKGS